MLTPRSRVPLLVVLVAAICTLPLLFSNYYNGGILDAAATYAIVAVGLNFFSGTTRQFSLGHAGFYEIGAFTAGLLSVNAGWPFWLDVPAGGAIAALAGLIVGIPTLRLSGP